MAVYCDGVKIIGGAGAGSATAPSFFFAGDPDTGFYNSAANTIGVAVGGASQILISSGAFQFQLATTINIAAANPGAALTVRAGAASSSNNVGGQYTSGGGAGAGSSAGGDAFLLGGNGGSTGVGDVARVTGGNAGGGNAAGGQGKVSGGSGAGSGTGGAADVVAGNGGSTNGSGGQALLQGGTGGGTTGTGGDAVVQPGAGASSGQRGQAKASVGGSTSLGPISVVSTIDVTAVGNSGTGEDNLISETLPASTLDRNLRTVRITAWGTTANTANAKTLKLYFGATAILTYSLVINVSGYWYIEANVICTGTDTQDYVSKLTTVGAADLALHDVEIGTAAIDDGAAITIKCTGEATSDNDIVQEGMIIEVLN